MFILTLAGRVFECFQILLHVTHFSGGKKIYLAQREMCLLETDLSEFYDSMRSLLYRIYPNNPIDGVDNPKEEVRLC